MPWHQEPRAAQGVDEKRIARTLMLALMAEQ
jgi:hypothetical protein